MRVCRFGSKTGETPTAKLSLKVNGALIDVSAAGNGPVDASFRAVESAINRAPKLELYSVNSITGGTDAQGEVSVRIRENGRVVNGHGADTDIVIASVKAYINAVNRLESTERAHPQTGSMI